MLTYLLQRLLLLVPTFFGITAIAFAIMHLAPGDPAELRAAGGLAAAGAEGLSTEGRSAVEAALAAWRAQYGLDRPLHVQYGYWLRNLFALDFGVSFKDNQPVWDKIAERLPVTIQLNALSILVVYLVAIPLGVYSATHPYSFGDQLTTFLAFMLFALPSFWLGTLAIVFLCGGDFWYLFPPGGLTSVDYGPHWPLWRRLLDRAWHLVLPVTMLSYAGIAGLSRFMRSSMLEQLRQDFVQTARAKGLPERVVLYKHVLRNSLIPIVTLMASILPGLVSGSVIVETIFSIPGLGLLGYEAVLARDYPVLMAVFTMSALLTLLGILLSDVLLTVVDPRITFSARRA
ncbi:MAG: peptide ABC transporter permease [Candidatus Tectimicrobiota bacterium]|nr:MAG: peptide ABC transporter permease [Candidatus Tectomicrobia bacterium]